MLGTISDQAAVSFASCAPNCPGPVAYLVALESFAFSLSMPVSQTPRLVLRRLNHASPKYHFPCVR